MIDREKTQLKVGIFVFLGLLLAMYVIFMLGGEKQLFKPRYKLMTSFKDISGLRVGAPIQLAGVKVGFVDKILFPKSLAQKEIQLTLIINKKFQDRIRKDSVATINTQGLLGDKFVYVSIGSEDQQVLNAGDYLESKETVSIYSMAEKSGEIIEDVRAASNSLRKFFEDMYASKEDLRASFRSLKNVLKQAEGGQGLVGALFYDPKGKQVVADIAASMQTLKEVLGRANEEDKKNGEVSGVLKNLREASKDLKDIVGRVNRGEGTIGGLVTDPAVYNDLRSLLGRVNRNKVLKAVVRSTLSENDKREIK
jgi:phospholipid/cholesterol/gamma-HCH transport system substrate-binding protein